MLNGELNVNPNKERSMTFQPGQSGNPNGRPKGIIDKRAKLREKLESHANEIIDTLIARAKIGDSGALKLCVERLIPRVKSDNGIIFELPDGRLDVGNNMLQIAHDLTQAVSLGHLTLEEAIKFSNFISHQRRLVQHAEQQIQDELQREERKKYWEARRQEETSNDDS
jgi:hypothetical protein